VKLIPLRAANNQKSTVLLCCGIFAGDGGRLDVRNIELMLTSDVVG